MDPNLYTPTKRSTAEQIAGLGFFAEEPAPPAAPPAPRPASAIAAVTPALHHTNANSQAAERKLRIRAGTNNARILAYLRAHGEATRKEIAHATEIPINVVTPCVVALRKHGYLVEFDGKDGRPLRERDHGYLLRAAY